MVRPRRDQQQTDLPTAIKEAGWKQIAELGAPALSLRGIARELNITAPAIYNYFPRRDDLVTALIVDAYRSLGDAQNAALTDIPTADSMGRLNALAFNYRAWATTHPQRYQLIFGTPIPGYNAPMEITQPAAAGALAVLIRELQAAFTAGKLHLPDQPPLTPELTAMLQAWQQFGAPGDLEVLYLAVIFWSRVHGLVSLEIGTQFPPFISDVGELYRRDMQIMLSQMIRA